MAMTLSDSTTWDEVVGRGGGAQTEAAVGAVLEALVGAEEVSTWDAIDLAVERSGVLRRTAKKHVTWLRKFGLIWSRPSTRKRSGQIGLTAMGRDWLAAAIPPASESA